MDKGCLETGAEELILFNKERSRRDLKIAKKKLVLG